jgi:NADH-quinone oxidoreductase E subunit
MMKLQATNSPFKFNQANLKQAKEILALYPKHNSKSALVPLLDLAQRQNSGWLSKEAIEYIADFLSLPVMQVYEVVTFYSMFNLKPVGKYFIQICTTTPCWLRGSDEIVDVCKKHLQGIPYDTVSADGFFSMREVECLGGCANAPVVQINDDYYEDLDAKAMLAVLNGLKEGKDVKTGSQTQRQASSPKGFVSQTKSRSKK